MPTFPELNTPATDAPPFGCRPPALLEVDQVIAGYSGSPVVRGVTLQVGRGEVVAILGPNGSGKSTLVKAVVGQIRVMDGRVRLDGQDITHLPQERMATRGVGYVPQERDVFAPLTVEENLRMGGYLLPRSQVGRRIDDMYRLFPVLGRLRGSPAGRLSGGERKLLAMGRVLMNRPTVLVLDEPTANLSPKATQEVLVEHVRRVAIEGTAVLLVEQKAIQALQIAHWAYIFVAGLVQVADAAAVLTARSDIGELFLGKSPAARP
jgi:ABC-type branched-subunit amino acid transport system ATPase component